MNTRLAIIRSEGKEHLCYREEECFVDVSYPMVTFTKGEDDFEIIKCDHVSYPMVTLNLPTFYRLDPHAFSAILNIR